MRTKVRGLWARIRPYFTDNIGLKLLSLACAIALYGFVHGTQDAQRIMAVDLVAWLPPDSFNKILITPLPTSVRLSLHGPRSLVDDLRPADLGNLQLDLRSGQSGRMPLQPEMLRIPGGVSIDFLDPPALDIVWDEVVERDIRIQVSITGKLPEGHSVRNVPSASPASLRARGPRQIVDNLQVVRLEAFDITGLKEGVHQRTLVVDPPPPRVTYDRSSATATVEITRKLLERFFSKVPVLVVGARAVAIPSRVDVRLLGPPNLVKMFRREQIVPRVNLLDAKVDLTRSSTADLPVVLDLDNVEITVIPKSVVVRW